MAEKLKIGSDVLVDGMSGKVIGYALHSKQYIVMIGSARHKLPLAKIKTA